MPSKHPLWAGQYRVEDMEDRHLLNALAKVREYFDDTEQRIEETEEWKTDMLDSLHEKLQEWARWEEIFLDELRERGLI